MRIREQATQTVEEFLKDAFTFLRDAMKASVDAVQIITTTEIFNKFK